MQTRFGQNKEGLDLRDGLSHMDESTLSSQDAYNVCSGALPGSGASLDAVL